MEIPGSVFGLLIAYPLSGNLGLLLPLWANVGIVP